MGIEFQTPSREEAHKMIRKKRVLQLVCNRLGNGEEAILTLKTPGSRPIIGLAFPLNAITIGMAQKTAQKAETPVILVPGESVTPETLGTELRAFLVGCGIEEAGKVRIDTFFGTPKKGGRKHYRLLLTLEI